MSSKIPAVDWGSGLSVRLVQCRRDWAEWFEVAAKIQGKDPHWVPPLLAERRKQWSPKHPFWQHAIGQAWLAVRGGNAVGTISAQVDQRQRPDQFGRIGYFGQFECVNEPAVAAALLSTAEDWLRQQACGSMRGPYDLNINQQAGLLVSGDDTPPMLMMGHAPRYYAELLSAQGLGPVMRLLAYQLPPDFQAPAAMQRMMGRYRDEISLRPINLRRYRDELLLLRQLFNAAWAENWGFVPMSEAEFLHMGQGMRMLIRPHYTTIAYHRGQAVGFLIALPNLNEVIHDLRGRLLPFGGLRLLWRLHHHRFASARVPLMGIHPDLQRTRLGAALTFAMIDQVRQVLAADGVQRVELSWILENNQGMNAMLQSFQALPYKQYQMWQKAL